jgi:hypothetical protein
MSTDCCCAGGRCRPELPAELTRREFIQNVAARTTALAAGAELLSKQIAGANSAPPLTAPKLPETWRYPLTPPRIYRGANLEAVAMPIGGIGTGTVWLDGQGRLGVWQIFNNFTEHRVPDSFFAVRARAGGHAPVLRVLQTVAEEPLQPVRSLTYEGGYPVARLNFDDPALPVRVTMEAFNPLIPTDTFNSSIPCAIFRLTARNTATEPAEVSLIATCQNAIGSRGAPGIEGVRFKGYGRNRNRAVRENNMAALAMEKTVEPVESGPVKVRARTGGVVPVPELHWFSELSGFGPQQVEVLKRISDQGGVVVAGGVAASFFTQLAALRGGGEDLKRHYTVFEDFERDHYAGWTVTGAALAYWLISSSSRARAMPLGPST